METLFDHLPYLTIAAAIVCSYLIRGTQQLFDKKKSFYYFIVLLTLLHCALILALDWYSKKLLLIYFIVLLMWIAAMIYGYLQLRELDLEQEDNKPIVHTLEKVDVIHHLAEDYMDLVRRIKDIVNHPDSNSQYSKEQLLAILDYKNQQANILEQYNNL